MNPSKILDTNPTDVVTISTVARLLQSLEQYMNDQDLAYQLEKSHCEAMQKSGLFDAHYHIEFLKSAAKLSVYENAQANMHARLNEFKEAIK